MRTVDLVVPVKGLPFAKSRLLASFGSGDRAEHQRTVLALITDTVSAVLAAEAVREVLVVTPDPDVTAAGRELGASTLPDTSAGGLNAALELGERHLRERYPGTRVGALLADLPALRPVEVTAAVHAARGARAFCPDREGTGTTLLLSAEGGALEPRFGPSSAAAHLASGAVPLWGPWPGLRCDVDTSNDLGAATELGLGAATVGVAPDPAVPPERPRAVRA
ncbi:2-phospho-L-lactate guanylyltransferase [Haloechinothrix alba]|uniref:Phosphoenolpyruvate guanylyltransferase n=1 Tax=Haloechinothrix alba TaxID=664784 RepID=A0A238VP60_9PSEU|nr:2-phospho-L-lactate guanylyltransferase [Haloechinothrix alba]SNR36142.1 2-phospho-L-lactate guanylyltransferase [Haloechinothrix alba]